MMDPLWITEAEVVAALSLPEAIEALEKGLALEAAGTARNMAKTHQIWGGHHTLHAIGAVVEGAHVVGTKTWAHTAGGATPLVTLWNSETGRLEAIIEAFALGQMRTGGISGVATAHMASADADELAIVGTGKQAMTQVVAVVAVRPVKTIRVFSPTPENRRSFLERMKMLLPNISVKEARSVEEAVKDAPIVTVVTRARTPVLSASMLARGTHVNAVGAITPEREEFTQDVFDRVDAIAVDMVEFGQIPKRRIQEALRGRRLEQRAAALRSCGAARGAADERGLDLVQGHGHGIVRPCARGRDFGESARIRRRSCLSASQTRAAPPVTGAELKERLRCVTIIFGIRRVRARKPSIFGRPW